MIRLFVATFLLLFSLHAALYAQELTLSPYSRYGVGDIFNTSSTRNAAMGGIGVATDNYFTVNRINPASYADMLFTTLDVSGFGQYSQLSTATANENQFSSGFQNLSLGFPSNKKLAIAMGFSPYSAVGYNISAQREVMLDTLHTELTSYQGQGGLNQAFLGVGSRFLKNRLRLGLNFHYSFGNTNYSREAILVTDIANSQSVLVQEDIFVGGTGWQGGFIYVDTVAKKKGIILRIGGMVDYTSKLKGDRLIVMDNDRVVDTTLNEEGFIRIPVQYGGGLMLHRPGHWSIGADFIYQDWADLEYFSDTPDLGKESRLSVGGEWIPQFDGRNYLKRIRYRFGGYYRESYISVNQQPVNDVGVTFGLGFPASAKGISRFDQGRASSQINLAFIVGRRGSLDAGLPLEEFYVRMRVGINLNDRWFIRRVVD
jgi:hypothetical protein